MAAQKKKQQLQELDKYTEQCNSLVAFFSSAEFLALLESFIDEFCMLFADLEDKSEKTMKERRKIFKDYEHLLGSQIKQAQKQLKITQDKLMSELLKNIIDQQKIKNQVAQYMNAHVDFNYFQLFMHDAFNHQLFNLTPQPNNFKSKSESYVHPRNQGFFMQEEEVPDLDIIMGGQIGIKGHEHNHIEEALKISKQEEQRRESIRENFEAQEDILLKQILALSEREDQMRLRLQKEEEEMLRRALEESMRLEEEERLKRMKSASFVQKSSPFFESIDDEEKEEEEEEVIMIFLLILQVKQKTHNIEKYSYGSLIVNLPQPKEKLQFRIEETPMEKCQKKEEEKINIQVQYTEYKEKQKKESAQDRQKELAIQKDILKSKIGKKPIVEEINIKPQQRYSEVQKKLRGLNVLQESGYKISKGKDQQVLDIDYYNKGEDNDSNESEEETLIFLNKRKKKVVNEETQKKQKNVIDLKWKNDDDF